MLVNGQAVPPAILCASQRHAPAPDTCRGKRRPGCDIGTCEFHSEQCLREKKAAVLIDSGPSLGGNAPRGALLNEQMIAAKTWARSELWIRGIRAATALTDANGISEI